MVVVGTGGITTVGWKGGAAEDEGAAASARPGGNSDWFLDVEEPAGTENVPVLSSETTLGWLELEDTLYSKCTYGKGVDNAVVGSRASVDLELETEDMAGGVMPAVGTGPDEVAAGSDCVIGVGRCSGARRSSSSTAGT